MPLRKRKLFTRIRDWFNKQNQVSNTSYPTCSVDIQNQHLLVKVIQSKGNLTPWLSQLMVKLLSYMYDSVKDMPPVKILNVKVYPFDGVAFTKDGGYMVKEIHISSSYIDKIPSERQVDELEGVLCHEMVHAFQYDGHHTAPIGFIEGVADFYRLRMGFAPPHWKWSIPNKWDAGYEKTAFFLHFIEQSSPDAPKRMNMYLRDHKWSEDEVFRAGTQKPVHSLFQSYKETQSL